VRGAHFFTEAINSRDVLVSTCEQTSRVLGSLISEPAGLREELGRGRIQDTVGESLHNPRGDGHLSRSETVDEDVITMSQRSSTQRHHPRPNSPQM
jgi:hypothetical protein